MSIFDIVVFNAHLPVLVALGNAGRNSNLQLQLLKLKTSYWIRRLAIFVNAIRSFITKNKSPRKPGNSPLYGFFLTLKMFWQAMGFFVGSATDWNPVIVGGEMFKELEFFPGQTQNQALRHFPMKWFDQMHPSKCHWSFPQAVEVVCHKWGPLSFRMW